ncbi:MAG: peptide/nickel transport system substrate-binding protein, partial [Chloroflexota bacterium]|nr:peptide/nickel transport system substrate-binding protein [Chloroflexota bacterium]
MNARLVPILLLVCMVLAACAGPQPGGAVPSPASSAGTSAAPAGAPAVPTGNSPKRLTAAILADPPLVINAFTKPLPGTEAVEVLVNSGLTIVDDHGLLIPQLAEAVPSIENGLWKIFPDGHMETIWKVRAGAQWHDGTPVTAADVAFTYQVGSDLPQFRNPGYKWVERLDTPDSRTIVVSWSQPFINADALFGPRPETGTFVTPLPEHLLSRTYAQDKAKVADLPYWGGDFVGSGPFRVREFIPGNHIVLDANDQYVLGRPRLDQVEVKFIADVNAMLSNVLSGTVDATMGRGLSPDDAIRTRDRWTAGKMEGQMLFIVVVFPQFINTNPPIITNVQFRRALLTAIDRQQMVDTLQRGLSPVADSFLSPANPTYDATISAAVRYPYDPQRASQMLADLGYRKDADGGLRDTARQPLAVEIRVGANSNLQVQSTQAVAEYWRAVGVGVSTVSIPPQQAADNDYIYTFPAFHLQQHPSRVDVLANFGSANTYYP